MEKLCSVDQIVGGRIRLRRIQLRMERATLASALAIPDSRLRALEAGRERAGAEMLYRICRQLGVRAQFFFERWVDDSAKGAEFLKREKSRVD
jgi:transcriptional regulator with XRE-family HTH domain